MHIYCYSVQVQLASLFGSVRYDVTREWEEVGMCGLSDVCLGPRVICFSLLRNSPLNLALAKCKHTITMRFIRPHSLSWGISVCVYTPSEL
jgi:type IV secretory pathway TraG/TraD family ATPase VirD4